METTRQKKIARLLQRDLAEILQQEAQQTFRGHLLTVTQVRVTTDLAIAKVYVSIFPASDSASFIEQIRKIGPQIRHQLATRVKNQLRKTPELQFYVDDSLDYEETINKLLSGEGENPIA